jgi:hypothetical protein
MPRLLKALCWAMPILLVAMANRLLLVDDDAAQTLFVVLPIVALMALRGETVCWIGGWRGAE